MGRAAWTKDHRSVLKLGFLLRTLGRCRRGAIGRQSAGPHPLLLSHSLPSKGWVTKGLVEKQWRFVG